MKPNVDKAEIGEQSSIVLDAVHFCSQVMMVFAGKIGFRAEWSKLRVKQKKEKSEQTFVAQK